VFLTTPDGSQTPVEAMRINNAQNVTVTAGNLVIGTSGKGIDFSATPGTGTSELLADYEEGTWTPIVSAFSGSITSYTSSGFYTKVGNQVTVNFTFTITNNGTGGTLLIAGNFPYAAKTANTLSGATREMNVLGTGVVAGGFSTTEIVITTVANTYAGGNSYGYSFCITYLT